MTTLVHYEKLGSIARLTLDFPPANGYSHEMMRALDDGILRARFDDEVQVLLLTGAGEKFFCAGADISGLAAMTPEFKYQFCLHANETLLRLENTPKVVIAALNGHTVGGGLEVALAADLRIMRRGSFKLGLPEVALGVLPGTGGTQRLTRILGKARALELMLSGRSFGPDEALALGLIQAVVEDEDFGAAALSYARSFTAPSKAALAAGLIKRAVQSGGDLPLEAGLALERELQARLFASGDAKRGMEAFIKKERPHFEGR
jgi:enoyl-CoA hydratase/carnithine racemase